MPGLPRNHRQVRAAPWSQRWKKEERQVGEEHSELTGSYLDKPDIYRRTQKGEKCGSGQQKMPGMLTVKDTHHVELSLPELVCWMQSWISHRGRAVPMHGLLCT